LSTEPPTDALVQHLDQCHYCTELLRALILAQRALEIAPGQKYFLCPGAFTLATVVGGELPGYDQHLKACLACNAEHGGLARRERVHSSETESKEEETAVQPGAGKRIAVVCGVLLALGVASFAGKQYWDKRHQQQITTPKSGVSAAPEQPTVAIDRKYEGLSKEVMYNDQRILNSALPKNRPIVKWGMDEMRLNEIDAVVQQIGQAAVKTPEDPGLHLIYGGALLKLGLMTDAYREFSKSEALPPRDSFRCWVMLQFALLVGDNNVIDREAEHLADDPEYGPQIKKLMEEVRKRRG